MNDEIGVGLYRALYKDYGWFIVMVNTRDGYKYLFELKLDGDNILNLVPKDCWHHYQHLEIINNEPN